VKPDRVAVQELVEPTPKDAGTHETAMVVVALVETVILVLPMLAKLFASPGYEACIVTGPAVAPFTVTAQVPPAERVHVVPDGNVTLPVPPIFDIVIVSPVTVPEKPDRVAVQELAAPTLKELGTHETSMVVVAFVTVRVAVPLLAKLIASPPYDAVTMGLPTPVPVTVTEQVPPADRAHVPEENDTAPVPPDSDHVMVSPVTVPENPANVAVQELVAPMAKEAGTQATAVVVVWIVRLVVPELSRLFASPG